MNEIGEVELDLFLELTVLTSLNLRRNHLRQLPASVGVLRSLVTLNLGNNRLLTIPSSLGLCKQLRVLMAENNRLEALPPGIARRLGTNN